MIELLGKMMKLPLTGFSSGMDMFVKVLQEIKQTADQGIQAMEDGTSQTQKTSSSAGTQTRRTNRSDPTNSGTPTQTSLFVPFEIKEPVEENYDLLRQLFQTQIPASVIDDVGTVHFARFMFLDKQKSASGEYYTQFLLVTTYDGGFMPYIHDFVNRLGDVFNEIFKYLVIPDGIVPVQQNAQAFGQLMQDRNHEITYWYSSYPDLTVLQIQADAHRSSPSE